jgi:hypothetical protein
MLREGAGSGETTMIKAIFLLKRKAGITHAQFREHYENSHAKLGQKYFGHLMTGYVRNYIAAVRLSPPGWDYDCVTEWVLRDEAALDEFQRIMEDPAIFKTFHDDEEHFLDRSAWVMTISRQDDVVDTGVGADHWFARQSA